MGSPKHSYIVLQYIQLDTEICININYTHVITVVHGHPITAGNDTQRPQYHTAHNNEINLHTKKQSLNLAA